MQHRTPPRFVPTLTEMVADAATPAPATSQVLSEQDQLVAQVMQRVNLALERRLRETIAAAVLEQTRMLAPLLREQIEAAVHETVAQALAELRDQQRT